MTRGIPKASQNRTNRAPLIEDRMSRQPETGREGERGREGGGGREGDRDGGGRERQREREGGITHTRHTHNG